MIVAVRIFKENEQGENTSIAFEGDELTSAISEAIIYLQEKQQEELKL